MKKWFRSMTNPPEKKRIGQIWFNGETEYCFLITDDSFLQLGIVRGVVISRRKTTIGDEHDILIPKSEEIFPSVRTIYRLSEGPIATKDLTVFSGCLSQELLESVITMIKKNIPYKKDSQKKSFAEILNDIEPIHQNAIELYEKSARSLL